MIAIVQVMEEGKKLRYTGAALSGLGGALTGGELVGAHQGLQKSGYGKQMSRRKNDTEGEMKHQRSQPGRMVGKSLLGAVPGVGSVSNVANQVGLEKQKNELKQANQKRKK